MIVGVVTKAALVDEGLCLAPALEVHAAVVQIGEAMIDVGTQRIGVQPVERRLGGVVVEGFLAGAEDLPPAPGRLREGIVARAGGKGSARGEDDGLEEVERPKRPWAGLLGQQQAGAAA